MANVDPIIAQNVIESEGLFEDSITEKIFLSPLAEKQWREDFSGNAQASKLFVLYLSKYNDKGVYVTSLLVDRAARSIETDPFFEENYLGKNFINYRGAKTGVDTPYNNPSYIDVKQYYSSFRVFSSSEDICYVAFNDSYNTIESLTTDFLYALRVIAPIPPDFSPRENPDNFFDNVSSVVKTTRERKIEDQEMVVNSAKKTYKSSEAMLESYREQFAELSASNPTKLLESQVEAISKFPAVKSVSYKGNNLIVYTNMLDIGVTDKDYDNGQWANVTIPLGEFEITFMLQDIFVGGFYPEQISFVNLTEYEKGSPLIHPHVQGGPDAACFSQWKENFVQAGHNLSIIGLVSNAINYLRTFNPEDDYGENIHRHDDHGVFDGATERGGYPGVLGEDGNIDRPGYEGEWFDYEPRYNGEFRDFGWEWYDTESNGENRNGEWQWYDEVDGSSGEFNSWGEFLWYEDNENYILDDFGDWINAEEDNDYILVNGEWINAENDADYTMNDDGDWQLISEIEQEEEEVVA